MENFLKKYQAFQEVKGLAALTIYGDRIRIGIFLDGLKARSVEIDKMGIETVRDIVRDRKWQANTAATWLVSIKPFCEFLVREGVLAKNPLADIKMKRGNQPRRYFLNDIETQKVLSVSHLLPEPGELAINLLADAAVRNHELLAIETKNINLEKRSIYLEKTKGGQSRFVFFSEHTGELIKKQLPNTVISGKLFNSGQPWVCRMVHQSVGIAFPNDLEKVAKITPHSFRHFFATSWVRNGGNLEILRNIIGWKSMSMMSTYSHLNEKELSTGYQNYQNNRGAVANGGVK